MIDPFAPCELGPLRLRNRILKAATFEGMTPDGLVTDALVEFHQRVAAGGAAMTTVAYCAVAPEGRTEARQIWWREAALAGLRRLTDVVHAEGAAASAQLGHAGPVADARSNRRHALGPSWRPGLFGIVRSASAADIARIVSAHADAAVMARDVGFDAVELHFGHNYFISAFLSPRLNRRRDAFGGPLENRARVARDVACAVRERVGRTLAVTAKLNLHDGVRGGSNLEDCVALARMLEQDGALDALELSAGSSLQNPMFVFRGAAPIEEFAAQFRQPLRLGLQLFGGSLLRSYPYEELYLLPMARAVRAAVKLPLILLGGITGTAAIQRAMAEGFELVAMARALLKEPDLVERLRRDARTESTCTHCNRCMPTIYTGTRCPLNDTIPPS